MQHLSGKEDGDPLEELVDSRFTWVNMSEVVVTVNGKEVFTIYCHILKNQANLCHNRPEIFQNTSRYWSMYRWWDCLIHKSIFT